MRDNGHSSPNGGLQRAEYTARINRAIDYIDANLDKVLSLERLAEVACFSPFHFHRIFRAMAGEPLGRFIQRIRIERAASKLAHNPKQSITEIAFECGFNSSAGFARAFREAFGMPAGAWRHQQHRHKPGEDSKFGKRNSKIRKVYQFPAVYAEYNTTTHTWRLYMNKKPEIKAIVEVKEIPDMPVAYIRHIGPYQANATLFRGLFGKLMAWAGPRGLIRFPETKLLTIYYDNPDVTEEDKLRIDVCISTPWETKPEGEVGSTVIPGGKFAVAHFEITPDQYGDAWNSVYGGWLPQSGYQPDDRPCFEIYLNDPAIHPEGKHVVDIYAPVKPL